MDNIKYKCKQINLENHCKQMNKEYHLCNLTDFPTVVYHPVTLPPNWFYPITSFDTFLIEVVRLPKQYI